MTREFQENTVAIILNEMFNDSKKLKTQMQFDALIENYAERIVKLFFIPDVSNCVNCKKEYERGIEDGKTIAEHGTTMWAD